MKHVHLFLRINKLHKKHGQAASKMSLRSFLVSPNFCVSLGRKMSKSILKKDFSTCFASSFYSHISSYASSYMLSCGLSVIITLIK